MGYYSSVTVHPALTSGKILVYLTAIGACLTFGIVGLLKTISSPHTMFTEKPFAADWHASAGNIAAAGCMLSAELNRADDRYSVGIANTGSAKCENVTYTIYYAAGEKFVTSSPQPDASDYYWTVGEIDPGVTYRGATIQVEGKSDGTELCATADNASDSCVIARTADLGAMSGSSMPADDREKSKNGAFQTSDGQEHGIWLWRSAYELEPGERERIITQAKEARFNVIYISADDYANNTTRIDRDVYLEKLHLFVSLAGEAGLAVDIIGGGPDWAKPENRAKGYALIELGTEFNRLYEPKIRGIQYDVEPYLLPEYETNKEQVLGEFIGFIDISVAKLIDEDLAFTVVIPHFYDSAQQWTPKIRYKWRNAYTFTHLLRILEKRQNSKIIIMAYRNFVEGENGTWMLVKTEIGEARDGNYSTKIIVAQETGDVDPEYVTFYGLTKKSLHTALEQLNGRLGTEKNFGGFAIHHADSFFRLKD